MEIDEHGKKLKLWVRRKKAGLKLICSRGGQHVPAGRIHEVCEREGRDLPCFEYVTTVVVETYRVKCPGCGIRAERVAQLPSKRPTASASRRPWGHLSYSGWFVSEPSKGSSTPSLHSGAVADASSGEWRCSKQRT